jgi:hypothetical protein
MKRIYVAGPLGANDEGRLGRVKAAIDTAERIRQMGLFPFVPHLMHYWEVVYTHKYECGMRLCLAYVRHSDALFRMPGHSPGADREVKLAEEIKIPVFRDLAQLAAWAGIKSPTLFCAARQRRAPTDPQIACILPWDHRGPHRWPDEQ